MDLTDRLFGNDVKFEGDSGVTAGTTVLCVNALKALVNPPSVFMGVLATGVQLDIASSSIADVMTSGTGAWQVTVIGLGPGGVQQKKVYNLNGQTVVTPADFWWRVFAAWVSAVGTGLFAAGDIYIVKTGTGAFASGVPATVTSGCVKIEQPLGSGWSGYYTVPPTKAGALPRKLKVQGVTLGVQAQAARFLLQAQPNLDTDSQFGTVWQTTMSGAAGGPGWVDLARHVEDLTPGTDLIARMIPVTAAAEVSFALDCKMV